MTRPLAQPQLHELYYYMALSRKLGDVLARLHRDGGLPGPLWLKPGLEAVTVGASFVPMPKDTLSCSLPSLGALLLRGVRPEQILVHVFGRVSGPSRGRDRSPYFGDVAQGLLAPASHAATHLGVLAGVAFANLYRNNSHVAIGLVSEEAVATGDFHEAINIAAVRNLPLVLVVVRNDSAFGSAALPTGTGVPLLFERVAGYGIRSVPVDGSELLQVVQAVETATSRARQGQGPTLIEANVTLSRRYVFGEGNVPQPFMGAELHPGGEQAPSESDLGSDPVRKFERLLKEQHEMTNQEHLDILTRVETTISKAVVEAELAPPADALDLVSGVFYETDPFIAS